jgi:tetratricopeptide (TPR) repeat protein
VALLWTINVRAQSVEDLAASGEALIKRGDYRRAVDDLSRAVEAGRDRTPARVYLLRARAYAALKQFRWAEQDFERALEIDPDNTEARQEMARWAREGRMKAPAAAAEKQAAPAVSPPAATTQGPPAPAPKAKPAPTPPAASAKSQPAAPGAPDWPAEDPARPRPQPLPARALATANLRDDTTWKLKDTLWTPAALPAIQPLKAVPAVPETGLDINDLTPAHYQAAVTAAKEAMRLVHGEMSAEEEKIFDAKWAPFFDYPCQEVVEYLNKLNPLLLEFLDLRSGYVEATRSYDEAQIELAQALAAESRDDAVEAMEILRAQAKMVNSLAAGMAAVSARIEALGEFPNPLAHKGRARRLHDEAMKLLAPVMFEGEWAAADGDRAFFKVIEDLGGGRWLVYRALSARYHEQTRNDGKPGFLGDHIWVFEDLGGGKYLELAWVVVPQFHIREISGGAMSVTSVVPPWDLNTAGSSTTSTLTLVNRNPAKISFPKQLGWDDVVAVAKQMRQGKIQQYATWRAKNPNAQMGLAGVGMDPEVRKRLYDEDVARLKEQLARDRAALPASIEVGYSLNRAGDQGISKEEYARQKTAEFERQQKETEAREMARLREKHYGEKPPPQAAAAQAPKPAASADAAAAEKKRREAEQALTAERRKLINADISAFSTRIEQIRSQIAATPDPNGKEQLNWSLMVLERNLQDKRDELTTLETGEWTRTRTTFDEFCFSREAEKNRAAAETWGKVSCTLARMERQIAQAPEDQRDRLREFWQRQVTPDVIARHDFARMEQASRTIFDQTQGTRQAEAAQYEEIAVGKDELLTGAERIKTAADTGLLVTSMLAGPAGRGLYAAYSGITGSIQGGPVEGVKQAAIAASNTARIINTVFEGYTQAVLQNLAAHAANPQAIQIDESGAGLNGALWAIGKEAAFQAAMRFVVQPAVTKFLGGGQPPARPRLTAQQMIAQSQFRMRQLRGREAVERFIDKSKAVADAGRAGASGQAIQQLRQEADLAYRAIKADYFAKNYLKNLGRNNPKAVHYYNSFDRANMSQYMQRIRAEAKRQGLSQQELALFSNSASKGGVGMDVDLGFREPPRFITQAGKLAPNPAYTQWSRGLTQTLSDGTVVRLTPGEYQRKMQSIMETSFTDHFGRAPDEAFLRFTYSGDPEAYKKLAWIGGKGLKTADFAGLTGGAQSYAKQAGDVSLFKVTELPKNHPSLGTYGVMQEQCRSMVKDITTKLAGSPRGAPISPNSPLAKAPKAVQDHYMKLRDLMDDFATNRIGPVEAERRLNLLTGGRGMAEVAEQFGVTLQGGVNQMRAPAR